VCTILRGKRLTKSELSADEQYPVFHGGIEPLGFYKECNREADTVMIINVGASAGTVGYSDKKFWSSDGCYCLSKSDLVIPKFMYYLLQKRELELKSKVRYAGIPTLDSDVIKRIKIPLPSLAEQARIVAILDKFEKLITSMEEGIPAEQIRQQKRYEYYRDLLLTFDRKAV
jgi:type I restriction enzyme S subunit